MRFIVRAIALALTLIVVAFANVPPVEAQSTAPFEINAILSTTGYLAFVGQGEARSLQVLAGIINKNGGIKGRPVKFNILDMQSSPQTALQIANDLVTKRVAAFIGPDTTGSCNAVQPIAAGGGPVAYCLSPGIIPPAHSYVFSAQVRGDDLLVDSIRYFKQRGWNRVALITTTDATGQAVTQAYQNALALPDFRNMQSVALEHFNGTDLTANAQIARIKAAGPQVLIAWAAGTPFGTLLRNIHDEALDLPVLSAAINANAVQLKQYSGFLPALLLFPSNEGTVLGDTPPGPARDAQNIYFGAYRDAGFKPEGIDAIPWDAATLLVSAYRQLGTDATPAQIRDWILGQRNWPGVYGTYNFTDGSQRGLGEMNALMFAWDPVKSELVVVSKPGGFPLTK
jgi:branched-chain amino acid transport system substrate-binding protein